MSKSRTQGRGQDLFTLINQPVALRSPGQTNSEEGMARDHAFAQRAEVTERLKALRLAQPKADPKPKKRSKRG
jgi:hypothetical protein